MGNREHCIKVSLSADELAVLDEHRGSRPRAVYLRELLHGPPKEADVATRSEAMALLTTMARQGKQQAAVALARELREGGEVDVMAWVRGDG